MASEHCIYKSNNENWILNIISINQRWKSDFGILLIYSHFLGFMGSVDQRKYHVFSVFSDEQARKTWRLRKKVFHTEKRGYVFQSNCDLILVTALLLWMRIKNMGNSWSGAYKRALFIIHYPS